MADTSELNKFLNSLVMGHRISTSTRFLVLLVAGGKLSAEEALQLLKDIAGGGADAVAAAEPHPNQPLPPRKSRRLRKIEAEEALRAERLKERTLPSGEVLPKPLLPSYRSGSRVHHYKYARQLYAQRHKGEPIPTALQFTDDWHAQGFDFKFDYWPSSELVPLLLMLEISANQWHHEDWEYFKRHRAEFPNLVKGEEELLQLESKARQEAA
jgi:hypothetical protein